LWLNGASYRKSVRRSKWEMAYGDSNGHVTDMGDGDTWSWKVKDMTPICLGPNILKTAGDAISNNR